MAFDVRRCKLDGLAAPDNPGNILGTGTPLPLLAAAMDQVLDPDAFSDVERPGTLGTVELVGGEREQVDILCLHVNGDIPDSLDGIGVEVHLVLLCNCRQFPDRFDGADLVVRVHDGDKDRFVGDRLFQSLPDRQARTGLPGDMSP